MTEAEITTIEQTLSLKLPDTIKTYLSNVETAPAGYIRDGDVLTSVSKICDLNLRLRADGYYHLPWDYNFFAVGSDPGDCVYYFDLSNSTFPSYMADHDYDDVDDFKKLSDSPGGLFNYFETNEV